MTDPTMKAEIVRQAVEKGRTLYRTFAKKPWSEGVKRREVMRHAASRAVDLALEEACKAVCSGCRQGAPMSEAEPLRLHETAHGYISVCGARTIRALKGEG